MPPGLFIPIRFGNHVALRLVVDKEPLFRYYTVVPQCFVDKNDQTSGHYEMKDKICFIIKIYQDGEFTSKLNALRIGDLIEMSDAFSIDIDIGRILSNRKTIYLLAAGTGIYLRSLFYVCE